MISSLYKKIILIKKIMEKIIITNKEKFEKILENIKKDSIENLHILADFDKTFTKYSINWKKRHALISVLEQKRYLWEKYSKKYREYFEYYYPFEINPELSKQEKNKKMDEWWRKVNDLLIENKLNKNNIKSIINDWITQFRTWVNIFLENLENKKIPLVFISANWLWTDAVELFFEYNKNYKKNIKIISNQFIWDEKGFAIWYKEPVINTFNKDETVLKEFPEIFKLVENRKNVILLWDSLWDPHMVDGFEYKNLLKIWFLNSNEEKLLESYKKVYDVIITWDWNFDFVNEIMEKIFSKL